DRPPMIRVLHLITTLDTGGTEMMLYKLLSCLDQGVFSNRVVSLARAGVVGTKIRDLGIPVSDLGMESGAFNPLALLRLTRDFLSWKPTIVQTWLYHADLAGLCVAKLTGMGKVVWNVRCSYMDLAQYRQLTRFARILCRILSPLADVIISNSEEAKRYHLGLGYRNRRFEVIPNGFDLEIFKPDQALRQGMRQELKVRESAFYVGLIARFDPMKDFQTFFRAAKRVHLKHPDTHFVLCGRNLDHANRKLRRLMIAEGVDTNVHLLGHREDVQGVLAGMDLVVSSSCGESFPNVVGEAMGCCIPCVVTDVGDSAAIVGDSGKVVPSRDPTRLANAIIEFIEMDAEEREKLGRLARARIRKCYPLKKIACLYERLYLDVARK
ncbi:MAG: glycosyltransferase, partial [bacterium]